MPLTSYLVEKFLAVWTRLFHKYPTLTVIVSIVLVVAIGLGIWFIVKRERERVAQEERKRRENISYTQQLDSLNNVQGSLRSLIDFVEFQKVKLRESEDLLNDLRLQREQLRPVVEANQRAVDAILDLQAKRAETTASRERLYAFFAGVLSSILASGILTIITKIYKRSNKSTGTPAAT